MRMEEEEETVNGVVNDVIVDGGDICDVIGRIKEAEEEESKIEKNVEKNVSNGEDQALTDEPGPARDIHENAINNYTLRTSTIENVASAKDSSASAKDVSLSAKDKDKLISKDKDASPCNVDDIISFKEDKTNKSNIVEGQGREPIVRRKQSEEGTERLQEGIEKQEVGTEEPKVGRKEPEEGTEESEVEIEDAEVGTEEPEVGTEEPEVGTEEPEVRTEEPEVRTEEPEGYRKRMKKGKEPVKDKLKKDDLEEDIKTDSEPAVKAEGEPGENSCRRSSRRLVPL